MVSAASPSEGLDFVSEKVRALSSPSVLLGRAGRGDALDGRSTVQNGSRVVLNFFDIEQTVKNFRELRKTLEPGYVRIIPVFEVWRPRRDLNPCYRRERRVHGVFASQ